jgi:predicted Abi (CAAX) family protease
MRADALADGIALGLSRHWVVVVIWQTWLGGPGLRR